jgi:hypothetical protein
MSSSIIGVSTNTALYTGKCSKCTGPIADYFVKVNRIDNSNRCIVEEHFCLPCLISFGGARIGSFRGILSYKS